ncbi:YceI family protein [Phycisphaerales bacterium AB-hyl4]|uniref:YceI family protein n=1 Tax=Natronomicrosphaera hydrolytica TaxID=3242702 RepID=A0ABV4UA24_9BACT
MTDTRWNRRSGWVLAVALVGMATLAWTDDAAAETETYEVDPVHTSIYFHVMHLDVAPVYGRFNEVSGEYELGDEPTFSFTVNTTSIDTNNAQRDEHLRSSDFFNATEFPTISFQSTSAEPLEDEDGYKVTGDMTLHGETHEITVDLVKTGEGEGMHGEHRTGFHTQFTLNRSDYGMDEMLDLVGDEVTMLIAIEGIRE